MRIGLIDVDSHNFPNLALMKISAYHKGRGDSVEWWNGFKQYDRVYKSKIFTDLYSEDIDYWINADEIIKGGTGYGLDNYLPVVMIYNKPSAPIITKMLQRWCNNKFIFYSCESFADYMEETNGLQ